MSNQQTIHTEATPVNNMPETVSTSNMMAMAGADPSAVAAAEVARAQIQLAYFMAAQNPRNENQAWAKIQEQCRRPRFAKAAIYKKPVGGITIEGPSARLAEAIIRSWGNVLVRTQFIFEDMDTRRSSILVIDLESNAQFTREIVIQKTVERKYAGRDREIVGERLNTSGEKVFIVRATEDEVRNKESSEISKTVRNEGLRIIPADVVDDAMSTARTTMQSEDAEDPDLQLKTMIAWFSVIKIKPRDMEQYLGHSLDQVTPGELQKLRGIYRAISDEETTWARVMEQKVASDPNVNAKDATDRAAINLKQRLEDEKKAASGKGEPAGDKGAEDPESTPNPSREPDSAPVQDDFEVMENTALMAYLEDHKRPRSKLDAEAIANVREKEDRAAAIDLCRTFAAYQHNQGRGTK